MPKAQWWQSSYVAPRRFTVSMGCKNGRHGDCPHQIGKKVCTCACHASKTR